MTDLRMDLSGDHCLLASCMVSGVTVARARFRRTMPKASFRHSFWNDGRKALQDESASQMCMRGRAREMEPLYKVGNGRALHVQACGVARAARRRRGHVSEVELCDACPGDLMWQRDAAGVEYPFQRQVLHFSVNCPCGQFRIADLVRWYKVWGQCRSRMPAEVHAGDVSQDAAEEENPLVDDPIEEGWDLVKDSEKPEKQGGAKPEGEDLQRSGGSGAAASSSAVGLSSETEASGSSAQPKAGYGSGSVVDRARAADQMAVFLEREYGR